MKQSDVRIAVTGGIGSGKSTLCKFIGELGYPVFSCDEIYSELVRDREFVSVLAKEFGEEIVRADGSLDRARLSAVVFGDAEKLKRLNSITHPAIFKEMFARAEGKGLCFFEVPLLFEGDYQTLFDGVIVVLREKESRIVGVVRRDGLSKADICRRMANQFDYDNGQLDGYYVLNNDGNTDDLRAEVKKLIEKITTEK